MRVVIPVVLFTLLTVSLSLLHLTLLLDSCSLLTVPLSLTLLLNSCSKLSIDITILPLSTEQHTKSDHGFSHLYSPFFSASQSRRERERCQCRRSSSLQFCPFYSLLNHGHHQTEPQTRVPPFPSFPLKMLPTIVPKLYCSQFKSPQKKLCT